MSLGNSRVATKKKAAREIKENTTRSVLVALVSPSSFFSTFGSRGISRVGSLEDGGFKV